jgi:thiol-disulfide isomerase/thioredoxin
VPDFRFARVSSVLAVSCLLGACAPLPGEQVQQPVVTQDVAAAPAITDPRDAYPLLTSAADLDGNAVGAAGDRTTIVIVFASWCGHCRVEMDILAELMARRADARVVGVNFRHHEEYDGRGDSAEVRAFVAERAPFMTVVPAGEDLFYALGSPPRVPTMFIYDAQGQLIASYDPKVRPSPGYGELRALLDDLREY